MFNLHKQKFLGVCLLSTSHVYMDTKNQNKTGSALKHFKACFFMFP